MDTIERGDKVRAGGAWLKRRTHLEPLMGPTTCGLHRARKGGMDGPSLGLIRPARILGIKVSTEAIRAVRDGDARGHPARHRRNPPDVAPGARPHH